MYILAIPTIALIVAVLFLTAVAAVITDLSSRSNSKWLPRLLWIVIALVCAFSIWSEWNKSKEEDAASQKREGEYKNIITRSETTTAAINRTLDTTQLTLENVRQSLAVMREVQNRSARMADSLRNQLLMQRQLNEKSTYLLSQSNELMDRQLFAQRSIERLLDPFFPVQIVFSYEISVSPGPFRDSLLRMHKASGFPNERGIVIRDIEQHFSFVNLENIFNAAYEIVLTSDSLNRKRDSIIFELHTGYITSSWYKYGDTLHPNQSRLTYYPSTGMANIDLKIGRYGFGIPGNQPQLSNADLIGKYLFVHRGDTTVPLHFFMFRSGKGFNPLPYAIFKRDIVSRVGFKIDKYFVRPMPYYSDIW